jgi:deoxyguanosine kinase
MDATQAVLQLSPGRGLYVAVAGCIGVGKTTLAELVARQMDAILVREVFRENPYLDDFYAGKAVRLQTELSFMVARYNQAREIEKLLTLGNNVVTDWTFPQVLVYSEVTLQDDPRDWALYRELYDRLLANVPAPDRLLCLDAALPVILERIRGRGRGNEAGIPVDYLEALRRGYAAWRGEPPYPAVWLDTTCLPIPDCLDAQEVALNHLWDSLGYCPLVLTPAGPAPASP